MEEHYIFRGGRFGSGYDLDAYNTPSLLPRGYAAMVTIGFGAMGAVLGAFLPLVASFAALIGFGRLWPPITRPMVLMYQTSC